MAWRNILGHDEIKARFRRALGRGRLAGSYLFTGVSGIGKRTFALELAKALLCQDPAEGDFAACDACASCIQVAAGSHPDLLQVAKPPEKSFLPLDLLIGDKEHRMREGLCHDIAMKPYMGGRKVAIVNDADFLNVEGANALLKTLEEPPPGSVLILIGTTPAKQLPTIRSRCQLIRFQPLPDDAVADLLVRTGMVADAARARKLAAESGGSLERAASLDDDALSDFRQTLGKALSGPRVDSVRLAKAVATFVDAAGSEASRRRRRLHHVMEMAVAYYRDLLFSDPGVDRGAAQRLERCLEFETLIDRNANLSTLIENWVDTLADPF